MKIASWNVNSIRVRQNQVLDWLEKEKPDVLGLQEIKVPNEKFPIDAFKEVGYRCEINGQKTYNGVALISREKATETQSNIPNFEDAQKRLLAATIKNRRIINVYVPNGQSVDSDKYHYKLNWLDALTRWLKEELVRYERLIVMGDFNITPDDNDVHDPEAWKNKILCSSPERDAFNEIVNLGLKDSFRLFAQPEESFSWWDYRAAGFRRNLGMRIDLLLVSNSVAKDCKSSNIDKEPRSLERPSDHAPVWIEC
ncbi:MAG: exodeoxyribonuclease III [Pseudomonadota bacterium]|nr:exodeoxyribonuclease III [Pseudomonadota bacterium]